MHEITVSEAEVLSISTGTVDGEFRLILSIRLDKEDNLIPINISLSEENSARVFSDIVNMFKFNDKIKKIVKIKENENNSIANVIN